MKAPHRLALLIAFAMIAAAATNVCASTLTVIPLAPWASGEYQNEGRAISPDGRYVVGVNYFTNAVFGAVRDGFFYDVANGTVIRPNGQGATPEILTGIGYRTDSVSHGKQLILDGMSAGVQANWMTTDGGTNWGAKRRDLAFTADNPPVVNSLAGTGSDKFYTVIGGYATDVNNQRNLYSCLGSGGWNDTIPCTFGRIVQNIGNPDAGHYTGVAATGRSVGWYRTNYNWPGTLFYRYNYVVEYPPVSYSTTWTFQGLDGTHQGEAWSVSSDGNKIFGRSPTPTDANWHGYKAVVTAAMGSLQSIKKLPDFPDTTGSTRLATPYGCSADGRYAVGMNYRGMEKAVLWDTGDANSTNWTVVDLTERAASEGILGGFTGFNLRRAYSVGTNAAGNPVVTGYGVWSGDGGATYYVRGFVMVVSSAAPPQPKITSITSAGTGSVTVHYSNTVASTSYTLQYNTNLGTANWYTTGTKTAAGTSDSQIDSSANNSQRYYRIHFVTP